MLVLLMATPVLAQDAATAYEALRTVGTKLGRDAVNHIISVTGVEGDPQPETWKVLLDDTRARGGVRELEVSNGRIISERTPGRSVVGTAEGATIDTARLNLDSSGAYTVASHTAERSHTQFATVSYALRTDERSNPIWIVTLQNTAGKPVGTIHIGANRGTVTRTEGMFSGTTMEEVASNEDEERVQGGSADEDNDENFVKRRIKRMFYQTRDETKRMFRKVRRSFVDFFNRD
ncbi:MAG: hypothetical protein ABJB22_07655 [Verrucomicrobiota bacterium]